MMFPFFVLHVLVLTDFVIPKYDSGSGDETDFPRFRNFRSESPAKFFLPAKPLPLPLLFPALFRERSEQFRTGQGD